MKDLLRTADLSAADFKLLLDLSDELKQEPLKHYGLLAGKTVVLYFAKHSTRTRLSFETAVARLGGVPSTVGSNELQVGRGETLEDTAKVVSRYAEVFVIRTFADDDVQLVAEAASIPVINALTDGHHPCQSIADIMTLRQHWGTFEGKKLAYVGHSNNVAHSLVEACALSGIDITIASPEDYQFDPSIIANAKAIAAENGGSITVTTDPMEAVKGAHAVYTDAWISMGDAEAKWSLQVSALTPYRVTQEMMSHAAPDAIFMHCLPAHRGDEVATEVIDGPQSVVFDQAENRPHTSSALLYANRTTASKAVHETGARRGPVVVISCTL
ncbi:MAG: ornithine carbamoyltransferase [Thermomicrobiales bacterium]